MVALVRETYVRCNDRTIFKINPHTLEALSTGYYDPYCFSSPRPYVDYMSYSDWLKQKDILWKRNMVLSLQH
jgi:hypothetical protein